jgi:hypothetical protein
VTSPGEPPPIACSLDSGSLTERIDEWRALVASWVVEVELDATSIRLVLRDSEAALVAAASLGQREKQCCGFFEVVIDIAADRRALTLRVPDGAEEAMATFVALLTP